MNKKILLIINFIIVFSLLCGCSVGSNFLFSNDQAEEKYVYDNTVKIPIERLRTLNPLISMDDDMFHLSKLVYDSLFKIDENLMPQPLLVKEYLRHDSDMSLEIKLKNNVRWHDGEGFDAEDVKFTIDALILLAKTGDTIYGDSVSSIKNVVIDENNPYTLTINYNKDYNIGIENLTFPILPSHKFSKLSDIKKNESFEMIGTGAYKCEAYQYLSEMILVPNQDYYGTKANSVLDFEILPDRNFAVNMTRAGDISLFYENSLERDTLLANKNINLTNYCSNEAEVICFNFANVHLQHENVRKAIAFAINVEDILNNAYFKNGIIVDTLYYPNLYEIENEGDQYIYNLDESKKLLEDAGYSDVNNDGYLESSDGIDLEIEILLVENDEMRVNSAKLIKTELDKLGISSKLVFCNKNEYDGRIKNGNFDLIIGGIKIDERFNLKNILHKDYNNINYKNDIVTQYLVEISRSDNNVERRMFYERMKSILIDELPYYCMFYKTYGCFTSEYFAGEISPMFFNKYNNPNQWECKYPEGFILDL